MDIDKKSFRDVIVDIRMDKRLTQKEMGKQLGVSQSYQAYIETGARQPNTSYLVSFRNTYGVNLLNYDMSPIAEKDNSIKVTKGRVR